MSSYEQPPYGGAEAARELEDSLGLQIRTRKE
jgi:hypothetical protein